YAYGTLGAHLDAATLPLGTQAEAAHRARRDALVVRLSVGGTAPPPAEPAYTLPSPVTDAPSALRLARTVEDRTASVWYAAVAGAAGPRRLFRPVVGGHRSVRWPTMAR